MNLKRHISYLKYVLRHKYYVYLAGRQLDVPFWILILHDWDKFLPSEWFPYARNFYNEDGSSKKENYSESDAFVKAWNQHQKLNKHHWQYWLLTWDMGETSYLEMPDVYVREMFADWKGAGKALGKPNTLEWYNKNYTNIKIHDKTRQKLEKHLNYR